MKTFLSILLLLFMAHEFMALGNSEEYLHLLPNELCEEIKLATCTASFEYEASGSIHYCNSTSIASSDIISYEWTVNGELEDESEDAYISIIDSAIICLSIMTEDGCEDEYCEEIAVLPCQAPTSITLSSENFYEIAVNLEPSLSNVVFYVYEVYNSSNEMIFSGSTSATDFMLYDPSLYWPCDTFSVAVYADCGANNESEFTEAAQVISFCEACDEAPAGIAVSSENFYEIMVSIDDSLSNGAIYNYEVYNTNDAMVFGGSSDTPDFSLYNELLYLPCDTFSILAYRECGPNNEIQPTDTVQVISFCEGCEVEITLSEQVGDYNWAFEYEATYGGELEGTFWTVNDSLVAEEIDETILTLPIGLNEICVTIISSYNCIVESCDNVLVSEPSCPQATIYVSQGYGAITVAVDPVENASSYTYSIIGEDGWPVGGNSFLEDTIFVLNNFDNFNYLHNCEEFLVSVQTICTNMGSLSIKYEGIYNCENGCVASFSNYPPTNFTSNSTAVSDIVSQDWSIDGEWIEEGDNMSIVVEDGQTVCLTITTEDGCSDEICEIISQNDCVDVMDIEVENITDGIAITYNGMLNAEGFWFIVYDEWGEVVIDDIYSEEEFVLVESPLFELCGEYSVQILTECGEDEFSDAVVFDSFFYQCEEGCIAGFDFEDAGGGNFAFQSFVPSIAPIIIYEWLVDSVLVSTDANPILNIDVGLGQEVCLNIMADDGCMASYCKWIANACPYVEISNISSNNDNQITVNLTENTSDETYETYVFDSTGNFVTSYNSQGPNFTIQDAALFECWEYTVYSAAVCTNGELSYWSSPAPITTACVPDYCEIDGTGSTYIDVVSLESIYNSSGDDSGYGNYTSFNTALLIGESATITLTPGYNFSEAPVKFYVYLDLDGNDVFDIDELVAATNFTTESIATSFLVPLEMPLGSTILRVVMADEEEYIYPCGNFYGEAEDYTVTIVDELIDICNIAIETEYEEENLIFDLSYVGNSDVESVEWTLDGELVGTEESLSLLVENDQEICVSITSTGGCEESLCETIEISCLASFVYEINNDGSYLFNSTAISNSPIFAHHWELDGAPSPVTGLNYFFTDEIEDGSELCYIIYSGGNCSDSYCYTFEITNNNGLDNSNSRIYNYPNPANNSTIIDLNSIPNASFVQVYTIFGQLISTMSLNQVSIELNTQAWSDGIYFYQVLDKNQAIIATQKMIVEH